MEEPSVVSAPTFRGYANVMALRKMASEPGCPPQDSANITRAVIEILELRALVTKVPRVSSRYES